MSDPSRLSRVGLVAGLVLFFFGLPLGGVVFFWNDSQNKMKSNALKYARESFVPLMKDWNYSQVFKQVSVEGRKNVTAEKVASFAGTWGGLVEASAPTASGTLVGEREDSAWQMTWVECVGVFEKGRARVRIKVAHRTTSTLWQVEDLEVGAVR